MKVPTISLRKQGVVYNAPKAEIRVVVTAWVTVKCLHDPERGAYRQILAPGSSRPASPRHGLAMKPGAPGEYAARALKVARCASDGRRWVFMGVPPPLAMSDQDVALSVAARLR